MEKQEQLSKLSILPVNKTVVFYSPIEGRDVLVRTGTIPDGSCFYHCLLHAYSKDYVSMDDRGRKKLVTRLRKSLAGKVDKTRWEKLSGGLVAKIPFQENVNILLADFYRYVVDGKSEKIKNTTSIIRKVMKRQGDDEWYQVILEMVPLHVFEKDILPGVYDMCSDMPISKCRSMIANRTKEYYKNMFKTVRVEPERERTCVDKLIALIDVITVEAENMAYNNYVANLQDTSVDVDLYTIGLVSNRFGRDVYFLDANTRMPYIDGGDNLKKRKSIIIMWTGGVHYEVVGRLLPGNRVQREFAPDDPLIKRMYTFLMHPEKVPKKYPKLVPYLSKRVRPTSHASRDRSRSRTRDRMRDRSRSRMRDRSRSRTKDRTRDRSRSRMRDREKGKRHNRSRSRRRSFSKSVSPNFLGKQSNSVSSDTPSTSYSSSASEEWESQKDRKGRRGRRVRGS